jgi:hypothetical protein
MRRKIRNRAREAKLLSAFVISAKIMDPICPVSEVNFWAGSDSPNRASNILEVEEGGKREEKSSAGEMASRGPAEVRREKPEPECGRFALDPTHMPLGLDE